MNKKLAFGAGLLFLAASALNSYGNPRQHSPARMESVEDILAQEAKKLPHKAQIAEYKKGYDKIFSFEYQKSNEEELQLAGNYCNWMRKNVDLKKFPEMKEDMGNVKKRCTKIQRQMYNRIAALKDEGMNSIQEGERTVSWERAPFIQANLLCNWFEKYARDYPNFNDLKKMHGEIRQKIVYFEVENIHQRSINEIWGRISADDPYIPEKRENARKIVKNFYDSHLERVKNEYIDTTIADAVFGVLNGEISGWKKYLINGDEWAF
jgi:uncharacterized protein (UPF0297 family)